MNNLDQVALKINRAAAELRDALAGCLEDTQTLAGLVRTAIDEEDLLWLQVKLEGLQSVAALMVDDGFLRTDAPLEDMAAKLRQGAFDRAGWKAVLGAEGEALVDRMCDREEAVVRGLEQLVKLRSFLHGVLRSMLTGMDEGGVGF